MTKKKTWEDISEYIKKAKKDPEFKRDLKAFIKMHTGKKK